MNPKSFKLLRFTKIAAAVALSCGIVLAKNEYHDNTTHFGLSTAAYYIGIWNLDNEVFVKKEYQADTLNGIETRTYKEQSLTGGHDLKGLGGSFGLSGLKDLGNRFQLHLDLYISLRYRFVEAEEHHSTATEYISPSGTEQGETTYGSKGKYDISLTYWQIDLPVNLRYRLPLDYFVESGVFISYILTADLKVKLISLDIQSYSAGMEIGIMGGFGKTILLQNGRALEVFSRFIFGVTPLLNDRVKRYLCDGIYPREWLLQAGISYYLF